MNLEEEILKIKERNNRVAADKAWEVSWTRRAIILFFTYVIALVWLIIIREPQAALKAIVPTAGYLLSTLSLGFFKERWVKNR